MVAKGERGWAEAGRAGARAGGSARAEEGGLGRVGVEEVTDLAEEGMVVD